MDPTRKKALKEEARERLRKVIEEAGISDRELEEISGGAIGCDSCASACSPGCQAGHVSAPE